MKPASLALVGLTLGGWASAQSAPTLSLRQLLAKPPSTLDVDLARANLGAARAVLAQLQADRTTLRADLLTAQGNLRHAQASLAQALDTTRLNLAQAYLALIEVQHSRDTDQMRLGVAQTELRVARERVKLGSVSALAVDQAQANVVGAQQDLRLDQAQLGVRRELLRDLLGLTNLPPLQDQTPTPGDLPSLAEVRRAALNVPAVVQADNAVALARLRVEQAQSEFEPPAQRVQARQALIGAQLEYQTQVATARQAAEAAYVAALRARAGLEAAQAALAAQKAAYDTARAQEKAGSVSRLQVQGLEVALRQARFAHLQAQQQAYLSLLSLQLVAPRPEGSL